MKALLLSAGEAVRLRPLTLTTPKCLLPLFAEDKTILEYWIKTLLSFDIEAIMVNTFHLKEQVIDFVKSLQDDRIELYIENELEPVGMVLNRLRHWLGDEFLVINSDTYISPEDVNKFLVQSCDAWEFHPICIGIEYKENVTGKGVAEIERDVIERFSEKPAIESGGWVWAGIAKMSHKVFGYYKRDVIESIELGSGIFRDFRMGFVKLDDVLDIGGNLEAYRLAKERFGRIKI